MTVGDSTRRREAEDTPTKRIQVGIAEFVVTREHVELTTSGLGSCVGVALYDDETGVAGLVHIMLPVAAEMSDGNAAKFADTGTELLVEKMRAHGANPGSIEAKIAGGSDMFDFSEGGSTIGDRNIRVVRETLERHGVALVGEDVGGDHGRSLQFETGTGHLVVKSGTRESKRL